MSQPTADGRQHAALTPPTRFAEVRFSTYRPQNDMQAEALREAERLAQMHISQCEAILLG